MCTWWERDEEGAGLEEHSVLYKYSPSTRKVLFKKTIFHHGAEALELEAIYGVAVDASGGLWVYWGEEGVVSGFGDEETNRVAAVVDQGTESPGTDRMPRAAGVRGRP